MPAIDYGILTFNRNNNVALDSQFKNYTYITAGSANLVTGINYVSIPNTNNSVVFAMRPVENVYICQWGFKQTGDALTHARVVSNGSITIQWVLFEETPVQSIPVGSYGMLLYDGNGNLTFSSLENYMRVYTFYERGINETISPKSINNYFITWSTINKVEYRYSQSGDKGTGNCDTNTFNYTQHSTITNNYYKRYITGMRKNGNQIELDWILLNSQSLIPSPTQLIAGNITCDGVIRWYIIGEGDTNVNVSVANTKFKAAEILDPT